MITARTYSQQVQLQAACHRSSALLWGLDKSFRVAHFESWCGTLRDKAQNDQTPMQTGHSSSQMPSPGLTEGRFSAIHNMISQE